MTAAPISLSPINPDATLDIRRAQWLRADASTGAAASLDVAVYIDGEYFARYFVAGSEGQAAQQLRKDRLPETIIAQLLNAAGPFPKRVVV